MSPFSDTTNLAPAVSGTTLFAHIRHMMYTTGTSYAIAVILYAIINLKFVAKTDNEENIRAISSALKSNFTISPLLPDSLRELPWAAAVHILFRAVL